jgi:hypothetical protein
MQLLSMLYSNKVVQVTDEQHKAVTWFPLKIALTAWAAQSTSMYAQHDLLIDATPLSKQLFNSTVLASAAATLTEVPSALQRSRVRSASSLFTAASRHRQMKIACMSARAASPG